MKRFWTGTAILAAVMLGAFATEAGAWESTLVDSGKNGAVVTVPAGRQVNVNLEETTKTCDTWSMTKQTGKSLKLQGEDHLDGDAVRPDGTFLSAYDATFYAIGGLGTSKLEFSCKPLNGAKTQTFSMTVKVEKNHSAKTGSICTFRGPLPPDYHNKDVPHGNIDANGNCAMKWHGKVWIGVQG
jgi:hypothetical protein